MARYNLGAVKAHVLAAANEIGPKYDIKTIYGWAPGQFDHPKGLALDIMINNLKNGKAVGDAVNEYTIANADRLGVTYTIWYRKYYGRENGFKATQYTGTSNPHTDHVHISFSANGTGTGAVIDTGGPKGNVGTVGGLLPDLSWITNSGSWARIGMVLGGGALILLSIVSLPAVSSTLGKGGKIAAAVITKGKIK